MKTILHKYDFRLLKDYSYLIGLDEAGRGALAGPVYTAACLIKEDFFTKENIELTNFIRDSKKMSQNMRELAYENIFRLKDLGYLDFTISSANVGEIDNYNITGATTLSFMKCLDLLFKRHLYDSKTLILLDGLTLKNLKYDHLAIKRGDDSSLAIAIASVLAKVTRDKYMKELALSYKQYELSKNKGYGTKRHLKALKNHGSRNCHRKLFVSKLIDK